jgi:uncharacterized protein YegP (UPF0339 family)
VEGAALRNQPEAPFLWEVVVSGIFELFVDLDGRFRFRLRSSAGEVIASSDAYTTWASAAQGIELVRATATTAVVDDLTLSYRFDGRSGLAAGGLADGPSTAVASARVASGGPPE